jgi:hypothetical protein
VQTVGFSLVLSKATNKPRQDLFEYSYINNFPLKNRVSPPMFEVQTESPLLVVFVTTGQDEPDLTGFHK